MRFDSTLWPYWNFCVSSILRQLIISMHSCLFHCRLYSLNFVFFSSLSPKVNTITKKNKHALQHPYQTRAKTKIMSEIEEVQEQMKANIKAMKNQMTSMMEAMLSRRRMMEDNAAATTTTSAATEADPAHPFGINQTSRLVPDMVVREEKYWAVWAVLIWCKVRILSRRTACHLTTHRPMRCLCPARMPTTLFLYSLKANNPR